MSRSMDFLESKKSLKTKLRESLGLIYNYNDDTLSLGADKICAYLFSRDPLGEIKKRFGRNRLIMEKVEEILKSHFEYRPIESMRTIVKQGDR